MDNELQKLYNAQDGTFVYLEKGDEITKFDSIVPTKANEILEWFIQKQKILIPVTNDLEDEVTQHA